MRKKNRFQLYDLMKRQKCQPTTITFLPFSSFYPYSWWQGFFLCRRCASSCSTYYVVKSVLWEYSCFFMRFTRILFLSETVINLNGSVSYIFLNFGWFLFLIFSISYGLRFLKFSKKIWIIKNASFYLFLNELQSVFFCENKHF